MHLLCWFGIHQYFWEVMGLGYDLFSCRRCAKVKIRI
ncbi:MAG: hypothetical protein OJF50_002473 [Nitrospira sp.]|nr:hypothetical protein [Nitrospira sp.]